MLPTSDNVREIGECQPVVKALGAAKSLAALRGDVLRMQRFTGRSWSMSRTVLEWWGLKEGTLGEKPYTTEFC